VLPPQPFPIGRRQKGLDHDRCSPIGREDDLHAIALVALRRRGKLPQLEFSTWGFDQSKHQITRAILPHRARVFGQMADQPDDWGSVNLTK
jgi:hypothetical protein